MNRVTQWVLWSPRRLVGIVVAGVVLVLVIVYVVTRDGVTSSVAETSTPSETVSAQPMPTTAKTETERPSSTPGPVGDPDNPAASVVIEPVQIYLEARENMVSANRERPADWLADARPALTADFYDSLEVMMQAGEGGSLGWEWDEYHTNGWTVEVSDLSCRPHGDVYSPEEVETALVCSYDVELFDAEGTRVWDVPSGWTNDRDALVSVIQTEGLWRVSGDSTGQAG